MSSSTKAWIAAASVGAVEALKDQGFARWNYAFRSLQQYARNKGLGPGSQYRRFSSSLEAASVSKGGDERLRQSEESLRKVMYLSCWGPN